MKRLDKFSILIENEEMGREVKRIADKAGVNPNKWCFTHIGAYYEYIDGNFNDMFKSPRCKVITFSEFKQMFEGEIIGYKCPMDCYDGQVKKGDVYGLTNKNPNIYVPLDRTNLEFNEAYYSVPKEIAMSWEPVYKEQSKTVMVGGKEWKVTKEGATRGMALGFLNKESMEEVSWKLSSTYVVFGLSATLGEIKELVEAYKELN